MLSRVMKRGLYRVPQMTAAAKPDFNNGLMSFSKRNF